MNFNCDLISEFYFNSNRFDLNSVSFLIDLNSVWIHRFEFFLIFNHQSDLSDLNSMIWSEFYLNSNYQIWTLSKMNSNYDFGKFFAGFDLSSNHYFPQKYKLRVRKKQWLCWRSFQKWVFARSVHKNQNSRNCF